LINERRGSKSRRIAGDRQMMGGTLAAVRVEVARAKMKKSHKEGEGPDEANWSCKSIEGNDRGIKGKPKKALSVCRAKKQSREGNEKRETKTLA